MYNIQTKILGAMGTNPQRLSVSNHLFPPISFLPSNINAITPRKSSRLGKWKGLCLRQGVKPCTPCTWQFSGFQDLFQKPFTDLSPVQLDEGIVLNSMKKPKTSVYDISSYLSDFIKSLNLLTFTGEEK